MQHLKPKSELQSADQAGSLSQFIVAKDFNEIERLHFSCPHCAKSYFSLESEFKVSNQISSQIFSCTNCENDFLVELEEVRPNEISKLAFQKSDLDFVQFPVINTSDSTAAVLNSQTLNLSTEISNQESKNLKLFLLEMFKQSLQFKYLPFYLALICLILGVSFAHMRNAIGLSAVLILLQIAFSSIFESKS